MITLRHNDPHDGSLRDLAPDLTPMLDILFILLVFFMLTAGAVFQSLDVKLPSSVSEELTLLDKPKHIMLEIRGDSYALDGKKLADFSSMKDAISAAKKAKPDYELVIAGDKTITIDRLLKVLTYLQSQGIETANILMKKEDK